MSSWSAILVEVVDEHRDTLTNPQVIAEVLSDSTEKYDRGAKFERYRAVPALSEYLLVSQDRVHIELYTRQPDVGKERRHDPRGIAPYK